MLCVRNASHSCVGISIQGVKVDIVLSDRPFGEPPILYIGLKSAFIVSSFLLLYCDVCASDHEKCTVCIPITNAKMLLSNS